MAELDIAALADRIKSNRFDGYTDEMLARVISDIRSGRGVDGLNNAVDALTAVSKALTDTESTLHTELGKLGVEWTSAAASQASGAVGEHADYSSLASTRVTDAAQRIFAQAEAFSQVKNRLPEPESLRMPPLMQLLGDIHSLLGMESDITARSSQIRESRQIAIDALNGYSQDSGDNLSGVEMLDSPVNTTVSTHGGAGDQRLPGEIDAGGAPVDIPTDVTTSSGTSVPVSAPGSAPHAGPTPTPPPPQSQPSSAPYVPSAGYTPTPTPTPTPQTQQPPSQSPPAPPGGTGGYTSARPGASQPTAPSGVTSPSASSPGSSNAYPGYAGGVRAPGSGSSTRQPGSGTGGTSTGTPQGGTPGTPGVPGTPGSERAAGNVTGATPGGSVPPGSGAAPGKIANGLSGPPASGTPGAGTPPPAAGVVGGKGAATGQDQQLPKGKSFGVGPQPLAQGSATGAQAFGAAAAKAAGASGADIAGGAAAMGTGATAGAVVGDQERQGRGVGRGSQGAGRSQQLGVGDLPEEEAKVQRNAARLGGEQESQRRSLLERAAPQDDAEDDDQHVRRYGIDDNDLFADQRMVSPDVIGDDSADEGK